MTDFDNVINRRDTGSVKWDRYAPDVLPLWVADMDFQSPQEVISALKERVEHGVFGYTHAATDFKETIAARMLKKYGWEVHPDWINFIPGVVSGLNNFCRAYAEGHKRVITMTPVYPPILKAPEYSGLELVTSPLVSGANGSFGIDFGGLEHACGGSPAQFILCNPQNPTGRVFTREELTRLAEILAARDIIICSDEIHCDLVFTGHRHIPFASIDSAIASRTVTFLAPSKTYNIAGLSCSIAIIPDETLRKQFMQQSSAFSGHVNALGLTAGLAAYRYGDLWLEQLLNYLERNRDNLVEFIHNEMPGVSVSPVEGTYLAWLDCRGNNLEPDPANFFAEKARVGLNDGAEFGVTGRGFVRLNFGCPRSVLAEALHKMKEALRDVV